MLFFNVISLIVNSNMLHFFTLHYAFSIYTSLFAFITYMSVTRNFSRGGELNFKKLNLSCLKHSFSKTNLQVNIQRFKVNSKNTFNVSI